MPDDTLLMVGKRLPFHTNIRNFKKIFQDGKIKAPLKGFYTFEQSSHCPIFEEPEKALKILLEDVLNEKNNLADKM